MTAPLILLEDGRGLPPLRAKLKREGWQLQDGWELGEQSWDVTGRRVVCVGEVADASDRDLALLAGARGAGLVLVASAPAELTAELLADLSRLGPVERDAAAGGPEGLDSETVDLLRSLAAGRSMSQAADDALMSLRTAHRRVSQARDALGVKTRAELLVEFARRHPS